MTVHADQSSFALVPVAAGEPTSLAEMLERKRDRDMRRRLMESESANRFAAPPPPPPPNPRRRASARRPVEYAIPVEFMPFVSDFAQRMTRTKATEARAEVAAQVFDVATNPKVPDIKAAICDIYGLDDVTLIAERRTRNIVWPRQIAMFLAKRLTTRSLPEIGRLFGNRDHTTVMHAVGKIEGLIAANCAIAAEVSNAELVAREIAAARVLGPMA